MEPIFITNITKVYPDMIKIIIYKEPWFVSRRGPKRDVSEVTGEYTPSVTSLHRSKTLVHDLVLCNNFDYFCTFTFNPDKIDRFNYARCSYAMRVWLHHQSDRSFSFGKKFHYLIIPEQHKSGAWHFHALISGYVGSLHDSNHKSASGRPIFNITSFRSGFTTAVKIDDREAVSNYITKYITKDFIKSFNKKRFFCSRGLKRPEKIVNSSIFSNTLPLFKKKISETDDTMTYLIYL